MKKIILSIFVLTTISISAQTTFDINWTIGSGPADITIEQGDSVRWTWGDSFEHSVTSLPGGSESFDSGILLGAGTEFLFTFNNLGDTDYQCNVHPGTMFGKVTVEEILTVEEKFARSLNVFPNPSSDILNVTSLFQLDAFSIYSLTGQLVSEDGLAGNFDSIDVAALQPGVYFLTLKSGSLSHTSKIIISK